MIVVGLHKWDEPSYLLFSYVFKTIFDGILIYRFRTFFEILFEIRKFGCHLAKEGNGNM